MTHVDLDQVADLDGGVLDPQQEGAVRRHLESCESCSQLLERVREVHTLLAAEPAPELPPAVAARLDDSLAAAVREREARTEVASLERAKSRRRTWAPRLLAAAVGLAVVGGGAYVASNVLGSNSNNSTSSVATTSRNSEEAGGAAGAIGGSVPPYLRLDAHDLKSQLKSALGGSVLDQLDNPQAVPTSDKLVAGGCVSSALGRPIPDATRSYRVTFNSRPAVLVISRVDPDRLKVWVVKCQPSPTVRTSTVIPAS
jgi:hypothetical protein